MPPHGPPIRSPLTALDLSAELLAVGHCPNQTYAFEDTACLSWANATSYANGTRQVLHCTIRYDLVRMMDGLDGGLPGL